MTKAAVFKTSALELGSYANSERTTYTFTVVATAPVKSGNDIEVILPAELQLPEPTQLLACSSKTFEYIGAVTCKRRNGVSNSVIVSLSLLKTIPALETFSFAINQIQNPFQTKPSGAIRVRIYESSKLSEVINEDTGNLVVITSIPYSISPSQVTIESSV